MDPMHQDEKPTSDKMLLTQNSGWEDESEFLSLHPHPESYNFDLDGYLCKRKV